jgi:hypothetical protein
MEGERGGRCIRCKVNEVEDVFDGTLKRWRVHAIESEWGKGCTG